MPSVYAFLCFRVYIGLRGTGEKLTRLAEKNKDAVFRLAYSLLKNSADADDVVQNALLRLYQSDKRFESDEHVRNWLLRVTVNECRMLWRCGFGSTETFHRAFKAAYGITPGQLRGGKGE